MERRLAAILAADVAGYSRLMGLDETGTLQSLEAHRLELVDGKIAEHHGRIVKATGDGLLVEFPSVVNAVACSAAIQRGMESRNKDVPADRRIEFRMGINVGDVIVSGEDIFGDGVNVAARLEGIAHPGGITVSLTVRDHVGDRLDVTFEDLGEQALKNIARPIRAFRVNWTDGSTTSATERSAEPLSLPTKPSIAVLPFDNMSSDPEQDYFADGLVEDLITNLSKNSGLFVIARNSTFVYKGRAVDIRQVAEDLGVRYVLEGSVRRAANRLRITGQLIEAATRAHIWADKFEGAVEDVFDLQDRLTESIIGAIEPSLRRAEIERARQKRPESLDAYDLYLRALPHAYINTPADSREALRFLDESLRLDPNYAVAHAYAAWCHQQLFFRAGFQPEDRAAALDHAQLALKLGGEDAQALSIGAFVQGVITLDYPAAIRVLDRALEMNGNSALALRFSAMMNAFGERKERGIQDAQRALRLSPFDPMNYHSHLALAIAYLSTGQLEDALTHSRLGTEVNPAFSMLHALVVSCLVRLRRLDEAQAAAERLLEAAPLFTISGFARMGLWPLLMDDLTNALRQVALPD